MSEEKKKIEIDPDILLECVDYVTAVTEGYVAIYENFQKILWTLKHKGVSSGDAATMTVAIVNEASKKAGALVPHKDPFAVEEDTEKQAAEIDEAEKLEEEVKDE